MRDYFQLQYAMMNRGLRSIGMHPLIAYVLGLGSFVLISEFVFNRTSFAPYVLVLIAWSIMLSKSERSRTEFLIIAFGQKKIEGNKVDRKWIIEHSFFADAAISCSVFNSSSFACWKFFVSSVSFQFFFYLYNAYSFLS